MKKFLLSSLNKIGCAIHIYDTKSNVYSITSIYKGNVNSIWSVKGIPYDIVKYYSFNDLKNKIYNEKLN